MSKPPTGLFDNTRGGSDETQLQIHTIDDNLLLVTDHFPISEAGYFGAKGRNCRIIEAEDPVLDSMDFYSRISRYAAIEALPNGKGTMGVFMDGSVVTHRIITSVPGSPAVDINIKSPGRIKRQKIHFVKGE